MGKVIPSNDVVIQLGNQSKSLSPKQRIAAEFIALNPSVTKKEIAAHVGVTDATIYDWQKEPYFVDAVYDTYMVAFGFQLPSVLEAMIREALAGNVQAGRLVLEHSGKLVKNVHVQVDSPFEKFLKAETDVEYEDAEIIEAEYDLDKLPERNPDNDKPEKRKVKEKKKIKRAVSKQRKKILQAKARRERYALRVRAKKVGIEPLANRRPTPAQRVEWQRSIEEAESANSK